MLYFNFISLHCYKHLYDNGFALSVTNNSFTEPYKNAKVRCQYLSLKPIKNNGYANNPLKLCFYGFFMPACKYLVKNIVLV